MSYWVSVLREKGLSVGVGLRKGIFLVLGFRTLLGSH